MNRNKQYTYSFIGIYMHQWVVVVGLCCKKALLSVVKEITKQSSHLTLELGGIFSCFHDIVWKVHVRKLNKIY